LSAGGPGREVWKAHRLLGLEFIRRLLIRSLDVCNFAPITSSSITQSNPPPSSKADGSIAPIVGISGGRRWPRRNAMRGLVEKGGMAYLRCDTLANTEPSGLHRRSIFCKRRAKQQGKNSIYGRATAGAQSPDLPCSTVLVQGCAMAPRLNCRRTRGTFQPHPHQPHILSSGQGRQPARQCKHARFERAPSTFRSPANDEDEITAQLA
jgi:hypothetical protein